MRSSDEPPVNPSIGSCVHAVPYPTETDLDTTRDLRPSMMRSLVLYGFSSAEQEYYPWTIISLQCRHLP